MKNFIIKAAGFCLVLGCLICALNYSLSPKNAKIEKKRVAGILARSSTIESVCLGRSHAAALSYEVLEIEGENMAMGGRDLASIEFWLKTMVPRLPNLDTVFVSISYSSLYFDNKAFSPGVADARAALYHSLPSWHYLPGDRPDFLAGKFFTFINPDHGRGMFMSKLGDKILGADSWSKSSMPENEMDQSARHQAYVHAADRQRAMRNNPNVIGDSIETIIRIHRYLQSEGIKCIFFTPPYHELYTKYFPAEHIREMKLAMRGLQQQAGVVYYDYSVADGISNTVKYFHNADHLNDQGKVIFSAMFERQLKRDQ